MGLTVGLVRKVLFKIPSSMCTRYNHERNYRIERSRWTSVRVYLCGDEFNSVVAEEDLASSQGYDATIVQHIAEAAGFQGGVAIDREGHDEEASDEVNPLDYSFSQECAAIIIQSVFRGSLTRRQLKDIRETRRREQIPCEQEQSEAASTEVQIGGSLENSSVLDEYTSIHHRMPHKTQSQIFKMKEEWDDSTMSSKELKLKVQNRLEAMTRRERALAYAFSQQLRICPAKKRLGQYNTPESNVGWSWLERWMATRIPDNTLVDDCSSKHLEPIGMDSRTTAVLRKRFDTAVEEKEICRINDVFLGIGNTLGTNDGHRNGYASSNITGLNAKKKCIKMKNHARISLPNAPKQGEQGHSKRSRNGEEIQASSSKQQCALGNQMQK